MFYSKRFLTSASPVHPQKALTCVLLCLTFFTSQLVNANDNNIEKPTEKIASIIIDDLGNNIIRGRDIINIPAALTIAVLPKTLYATQLAKFANENNKEVMLHMPMQSIKHRHLSPDLLNTEMTEKEFKDLIETNLDSVPFIRGINNHMGSLLTSDSNHMSWLMDSLSQRGNLYFVDSRTTNKSVAEEKAVEYNVPNMTRDFFLDPDNNEITLRKQFVRFVNLVNKRGYALAIAHPYPTTIKFLQQNIDKLEQQGIRLVPASHLIDSLNKKASSGYPIATKSNVVDDVINTANYSKTITIQK